MGTLRWLHRWLGLILGVFISIIGLTGSWLIYDREIATPEYVLKTNKVALPLQSLFLKASSRLPVHQDVQILFPKSPTFPYEFKTKEKQIVINPYTGEVLDIRSPNYWPFGWLLHLHSELLLGKDGKQISGWIGIGLILITIIGIYLWQPKKWKSGFKFRAKKSQLVWHYDLHRLVGILSAPLLMVALVTGVSLSFSQATSVLVNGLFNRIADKPPIVINDGKNQRASLDTVLLHAKLAMKDGHAHSMLVPSLPIKPIVVRMKTMNDPHPNGLNLVYLHPQDGEVLEVKKIDQSEPAKRWFNWAFPIHTGQVLPGHLWLLLTVGLMPTFLMLTGVYLYLVRRFK
ncbi:MAG: hypothetical protein CTY33_07035 [Methylotenera sp.]|nr:MAG: hypothetical protein CTY33_07035 [Methylotenera sp.]